MGGGAGGWRGREGGAQVHVLRGLRGWAGGWGLAWVEAGARVSL